MGSNKYALETSEIPVTAIIEEVGQISPEKEVPQDGQTSDNTEKAEQETKEATSESEETKVEEPKKEETSEKQDKKYANLFTTKAGLFKSAQNLAIALDDEIDFKDMTAAQVEKWFTENRPRLEKEGFKGDKVKAKRLNKDIRKEEKEGYDFGKLEAKLDKVLETKELPKKEEPKELPLEPPIEPEFDEDLYQSLTIEDQAEAANMFREYRKAMNDYNRKLVEYEGKRLVQVIAPRLQEVEKLSKAEQERQKSIAQQEANENAVKEWGEAKTYIEDFVDSEQGKGAFAKYEKVMDELLTEDGDYYVSIGSNQGKKKAMFKLYQNAVEKTKRSDTETRIKELEEIVAKIKNGETLDQIQAAKEAGRVTGNNGGVNPKNPAKMTEQEKFETQMRGGLQTSKNKYAINTYY